jgi:phosphohistidine phosphatase
MRRLFLLRHAKAVPATSEADIDRKLAGEGLNDAAALGAYFIQKQYKPDFILCSPSRRTRQTLGGLQLDDSIPLQEPAVIYTGAKPDLLSLIHYAPDGAQSVLMVGHNPSIHELALMLADEESALYGRLLQGFKPGAMVVLDCAIEKWSDLVEGKNALADLTEPLDYNAPSTPARWM